uniref:Uncharacterized protein LOC113786764 n=1 Tax=Cicer arietinum TaxID=3827 RepID=A0A3Q7Y0Y7_CICAR|nr:uncharacterized protein LOC113786764 [Cicer arietinum]
MKKIARLKRRMKMVVRRGGAQIMCLQDLLDKLQAQERRLRTLCQFRQARFRRKQLINLRRLSTFPDNTTNNEAQDRRLRTLCQFRQARFRRKQLINLRRLSTFPNNTTNNGI